jgi:hypothetical protein
MFLRTLVGDFRLIRLGRTGKSNDIVKCDQKSRYGRLDSHILPHEEKPTFTNFGAACSLSLWRRKGKESNGKKQATGCLAPDAIAGCRLSAAADRLQVAGYRLQVAGYRLQVRKVCGCQPPVPLFITGNRQPATGNR